MPREGKLLRRWHPIRVRLADPLEGIPSFRPPSTRPPFEVVAVEQVTTALGAEEHQEIKQRDEPGFGGRVEKAPPSGVLFRPEEVHPASHEWDVRRIGKQRPWAVAMADDGGGLDGLETTVADVQHHGVGAIQAGSVDPDRPAR